MKTLEEKSEALNMGIGGAKIAHFEDPDKPVREWKRDTSTDDMYAYDEISPYGLEALAKVCREGFKHGKGNWRDHPQPEGVVINHAISHLVKYMQGDREEDHLAKVAWGMFTLIHYRDSK